MKNEKKCKELIKKVAIKKKNCMYTHENLKYVTSIIKAGRGLSKLIFSHYRMTI